MQTDRHADRQTCRQTSKVVLSAAFCSQKEIQKKRETNIEKWRKEEKGRKKEIDK